MWQRRRLRSRKAIARRRKKTMVLSGLAAILFLVTTLGLAYLSYRPEISIQHISINGLSTVSSDDVQRSIDEELSGRYFYIFSKKNSLLYPREALRNNILSSFKRIKSVSLSVDGLTELTVRATERSPHALWCGAFLAEELETCYFLDKDGLIYATAPDFTGSVFVVYYVPIEGEPVGTQLFSPDEFKNVQDLFLIFERIGLPPTSLSVQDNVDFDVTTESGARVIFSRNQNFARVAENLETTLSSESLEGRHDEIDYIDLRFGNKVYFKLQ